MVMLYQETIMDHYRHPRHQGKLACPSVTVCLKNVSCGDQVTIHATIESGRITQIAFEGTGCVISQAAASMVTEYALGKDLAVLASFDNQAMKSLLGIELGPLRVRCGLLALEALHQALKNYQSNPEKEQ